MKQPKSGVGTSLSFVLSRLFFPTVIVLWLLMFFFARTTTQSPSLRSSVLFGSQDAIDASSGSDDVMHDHHIAPNADGGLVQHEDFDESSELDHLVVVAGHAVMKIDQVGVGDRDDNAWYLLKYQRGQGFPGIISSHIQRGIKIMAEDPRAVLIFSGGQTRKDVGPTSEAASYYYLAQHQKWIPETNKNSKNNNKSPVVASASQNENGINNASTTPPPRNRVYLEEFARDSLENLLFSLCRFREAVGRYPKKITIVGFDFKAARFTELHRVAIGFPDGQFEYSGVTPALPFDRQTAATGEAAVMRTFEKDPYGCSPLLEDKRHIRNPFRRTAPYDLACPELRSLMHHCGSLLGKGEMDALPWNDPDWDKRARAGSVGRRGPHS